MIECLQCGIVGVASFMTQGWLLHAAVPSEKQRDVGREARPAGNSCVMFAGRALPGGWLRDVRRWH